MHVITAHGVHIWCWAPYPTCVLLVSFPDSPEVLQRCRDSEAKVLFGCKKMHEGPSGCQQQPVTAVWGLHHAFLRGFSSAKHNNCAWPRVTHFPQQPWLHVSRCVLCASLFTCFVALLWGCHPGCVITSPLNHSSIPEKLENLCNVEILSVFHVGT